MQAPRVVLEWSGWRLVHWKEKSRYSTEMIDRSCLEAKYTDRLGEPSWRDADEHEAALKALGNELANKDGPMPSRLLLIAEAAVEYLSEQGACDNSPDDGSSSLCENPECRYCALARAVENANG